jgi:tryptophan synthase alpha chain
MLSYSLVYRRGAEAFLDEAKAAGLSGAIVPDLPAEESESLAAAAKARGLDLVQLVTPTTGPERLEHILSLATGFLYCVSVSGITGARTELPAGLVERLAWLRSRTALPLCVGFGIAGPEHVRRLRDHADGFIVGSALVRLLEGDAPVEERIAKAASLARSLAEAAS